MWEVQCQASFLYFIAGSESDWNNWNYSTTGHIFCEAELDLAVSLLYRISVLFWCI